MQYGQMTLSIEMVTPAIAKKWEALNKGNRRLRDATASQYARDMLDGNWVRKPVAICFDENNVLGNGQHTLRAIINSGQPQEMLVARNVPREAIAAMDRGITRTLNDVAHFLGADIESRRATVARMLIWGPRDTSAKSFSELLSAYQTHAEVIDLVCDSAPKSAGMNASMLSVCAKAAYTQDRAKIQRFLQVLRSGLIAGEHESAAIRLRDFGRSLRGANGVSLRVETYNKTMSALSWFLDSKPMGRLYGTSADLFPTSIVPTFSDKQS